MLYISGEHALNLPCSLDTCGDWHTGALQWEKLRLRDSRDSVFGDYGIELRNDIPGHPGYYYVANHIRALLDMVADGDFPLAQGMADDFICNPKYDEEVFEKISELKGGKNWDQIRLFVYKEYGKRWKAWEMKHISRMDRREILYDDLEL